MASIRYDKERNSWRVNVRVKGYSDYASFKDENTAQLWGEYKEDLFNKMANFNPPPKELISVHDAFDMKIESLERDGKDSKHIKDYRFLKDLLRRFWELPISKLDKETIQCIFDEWKSKKVVKGGMQTSDYISEKGKTPSKRTLLKRISMLGSVFNMLQEQNIFVDNHAESIIKHYRKYG